VATRIRELALEHNVPLLEAPPLARALYHNVEIDREIPGALYGAVAQVLAWVYQLRKFKKDGGTKPDEPENLEVPPELDKGSVPDSEADQEAAEALAPEESGNGTNGPNDPMKGSTA
jgi:flagellar biosynthetic protein FlhB